MDNDATAALERDVHPEAMHRAVLMLVAQGVDVEDAYSRFEAFRLHIKIGAEALSTEGGQICLLTIVELARRIFHGGISVEGCADVASLTALTAGRPIGAYLDQMGVDLVAARLSHCPEILIGSGHPTPNYEFAVRAVFGGWRAACIPANAKVPELTGEPNSLAAIAAAALCVAETFFHITELRADAGRRIQAISLWAPDEIDGWATTAADGPAISLLPTALTFSGLGHLGQAYLWVTGALPYADPAQCTFWLQDFDRVGKSTPSTSILSDASDIGEMKTRVTSRWLEQRAFLTRIVEREFTAEHPRLAKEPTTLLCGFDNPEARRMLCSGGHSLVLESGLGSGPIDYRMIRTHTLPDIVPPQMLWPDLPTQAPNLAAFEQLRAYGLDDCGIALLAGKAVGVPFVGMFAACLTAAELLRSLHGGPRFQVQDVDLANLKHRSVARSATGHLAFPAFTEVRAVR